MRSFSLQYESSAQLSTFAEEHRESLQGQVMIQIFSGVLDPQLLDNVIQELQAVLPNAVIVGATTAGEVHQGAIFDNTLTLVFSVFEKTRLSVHYIENPDKPSCAALASQIVKENTRAIICFTECFSFDPVHLFSAIYEVNPKTIIAGGAAGDNGQFKQTYVVANNKVYDKGAVLCALHSDVLQVTTDMALNWIPVGREMEVTASDGNTVFEINEQPVLDVYRYYLGDNITLDRPYEFPLIKVENGVDIGRSCVAIEQDGSFVFAGHLYPGDKVRFSVGNVDEAEQHARFLQGSVNRAASESIFTYSCFGRRTFLGQDIDKEFLYLQDLAPSYGFFSFGEFYSTGLSNQVLSNTTTVLSLCEDPTRPITELDSSKKLEPSQNRMRSLTCLVNVTQRELHESIELLKYAQEQLIETERMASLGSLVAGVSHEINTPVGVALTGNSQVGFELNRLKQLYESNTLSEEALQRFIQNCSESTNTVQSSLENAVKLVNSFKSISVDQHCGEIREFNFRQYVDEIFVTFKSELKTKCVNVVNDIPEQINICNNPGIFVQIFSNLIMNAIHHAFIEGIEGNEIRVFVEDGEELVFHFVDNGNGVPAENVKNIFDPFFTTARGQGGSGLGLNIVYNLVTQSLNGGIEVVDDQRQGFHLRISLEGK